MAASAVARRRSLIVCRDLDSEFIGELKRRNWTVRVVTSGQNAVLAARRELFELIVLTSGDCEMDLIETLFNLNDVQEKAFVVILASPAELADLTSELAAFAAAVVLESDFGRYLDAMYEAGAKRRATQMI